MVVIVAIGFGCWLVVGFRVRVMLGFEFMVVGGFGVVAKVVAIVFIFVTVVANDITPISHAFPQPLFIIY